MIYYIMLNNIPSAHAFIKVEGFFYEQWQLLLKNWVGIQLTRIADIKIWESFSLVHFQIYFKIYISRDSNVFFLHNKLFYWVSYMQKKMNKS